MLEYPEAPAHSHNAWNDLNMKWLKQQMIKSLSQAVFAYKHGSDELLSS